ncbi:hypothetical protein A3C09_04165 [Candidatus Uhrbacteria bacterium RIFCSPHIGHO2_02_FULL_47_44]|uniref:protein adenylyltransferase n=1 Tax=Candidatus Uhrbacteria bacterium RIFCSPLOWO2_02_FULL_48_18 TaxID=1802408 RepID=A0A1F7VAU6_9BACT|nr:MAG: hypothetical protein A2839_00285 [Candidatus Uhrbacteria bacterium RIFCSPHIGHO2_01_FULL_47_10]OGL71401.1 MAG: hypothetical protein A3C09_04165 [Candidatus Uhrbacteria bacterium RIFCSPHIGHO2_02_FULL_47_44]OGL76169.1 MAG: hypothetical protein A3E97_02965 [Candidatus Uhrbacteria bacterium RIFCSPHIGHO2_12_FULL_47_12]OGL81911.1 MAG: hypothetical protein A3B20_02390 [Candidatus Uhrbacteria bacterium RIFCSPLOWO2_01_FULL_47_17]OGL87074.1 MAG: hypothetical protein A3I41_03980 [Candidatus Uhrbact
MASKSRYNAAGDEAWILNNKLDIKDEKDLGDTETLLLQRTNDHFMDALRESKLRIDLALLFEIHQYFLGTLYTWAGKLRTVDISKNGTLFCSSNYLTQVMKEFEKLFQENIPIETDSKSVVAKKIALVHCELNAIHPFREGNGRTIRLFLDLMVCTIGYQPIDWSVAPHKEYLSACVKGMEQNYKPMQKIVFVGLKK